MSLARFALPARYPACHLLDCRNGLRLQPSCRRPAFLHFSSRLVCCTALLPEENKRSNGADLLKNVTIVLCKPQGAQNVGSVARLMQNFGLQDLRVVSPGPFVVDRDDQPGAHPISFHRDTREMAVAAEWILDAAARPLDAEDAVRDCSLVLGTTARTRRGSPVVGPREAARMVADELAAGGRVALLFGNERTGLTTEELRWAHASIAIPMAPLSDQRPRSNDAVAARLAARGDTLPRSPVQRGERPPSIVPSLNLSQAVGIICWEIFQECWSDERAKVVAKSKPMGRRADVALRALLRDKLMDSMEMLGLLTPQGPPGARHPGGEPAEVSSPDPPGDADGRTSSVSADGSGVTASSGSNITAGHANGHGAGNNGTGGARVEPLGSVADDRVMEGLSAADEETADRFLVHRRYMERAVESLLCSGVVQTFQAKPLFLLTKAISARLKKG